MIADGTKSPSKISGRKRLKMEWKRLSRNSIPEKSEDMEETEKVPKLKPRKVIKGKFAHRQG
jgi:hypothetical protein